VFRAVTDRRAYSFGFLLLHRMTLAPFACALDALRLANRAAGEELYTWRSLSLDGEDVVTSTDLRIGCDAAIGQDVLPDVAVVCGGLDLRIQTDRALGAWLRTLNRSGAQIGGLCTGSYALAHFGLLNGHRCTVHWESLPGFAEDFPEIEVMPELFEIDRNRFTCAGGTAVIDMMLTINAMQQGNELAAKVADFMMHERVRGGHDHQRTSLPQRLGVRHPKLIAIIELMERNLEEPLSRTELADFAGLSARQLERLFRKYLNRSPARYYLELRLNRARLLLLQTNMSVIDVALACGFVSASHFSKCYRDFFGRTPRRERGLPTLEQELA